MEKRNELYRGKAKSVYTTDDPDRLVLLFRNDTSAFDGKKIEQLDRKGMVNNRFHALIMQKLEEAGIRAAGWGGSPRCHYEKCEMNCHDLTMRNVK